MPQVYLIIGSNLGDRLWYFNQAKKWLIDLAVFITKESAIYETEPWGFEDNNLFINQVIVIETHMTPASLLTELKNIEVSLGRIHKVDYYEARCIDIDILFYESLIINTTELIIPHPEIANRRFVLVPLNELNPSLYHPVLMKTCSELLAECKDTCRVDLFSK